MLDTIREMLASKKFLASSASFLKNPYPSPPNRSLPERVIRLTIAPDT